MDACEDHRIINDLEKNIIMTNRLKMQIFLNTHVTLGDD